MRPDSLHTYFAPLNSLPGVGPRMAKLAAKLLRKDKDDNNHHARVVDLLRHLPVPEKAIHRARIVKLNQAQDGDVVTLELTTISRRFPPTERAPRIVVLEEDGGELLEAVFFRSRRAHLEELFPIGEKRVVSGRLERRDDALPRMAHPDYVKPPSRAKEIPAVEPFYATIGSIPRSWIRRTMAKALDAVTPLAEWLDEKRLAEEEWSDLLAALRSVHQPADMIEASAESPARRRIVYDELLANQLGLSLARRALKSRVGRPARADGKLRKQFETSLPFELRPSQRRACDEIVADMTSSSRMMRLLQGDVGSGKTVVAAIAASVAIEDRGQAAIMAPLEILARQHHETFSAFFEPLGVRVEALTGREKGRKRDALLADLKSGEVRVVCGTHALLQEDVEFRDLALAIIDEQQRFGVRQRMTLQKKGRADVLVTTATPIPRTLRLAAYGNIDVSTLENDPNRPPIDTRVMPTRRIDDVVAALGRALRDGRKAYWACPLVDGGDNELAVASAAAAEERFKRLADAFPGRVGLVHGRMKAKEKDEAIRKFRDGETSLLVATSAIEVGIDVPDATVMVIENAERFGLAQLHQMRGRIGRRDQTSHCLLLHDSSASENALERLGILRRVDDGFKIAEEDLRLRGEGDLLGERQANVRVDDLALRADMLEEAHAEAASLAEDDRLVKAVRDPENADRKDRGRAQALRILLHLFELREGVRALMRAA